MDQEYRNPELLPHPASRVPRSTRLVRGLASERLMWLGAALLIIVLLLTACGSSGKADDGVASLADDATATGDTTDQVSASPTSEKDPEEALLAYTDCMRANGVDMPDPQFDEDGNLQPFTEFRSAQDGGEDSDEPTTFGPGADREEFEAAEEECGDILEGVTLPGPSEEELAAMEDAAYEFAQCMRDEGIDMPDPVFQRGDLESGDGSVESTAEPGEQEQDIDPDDPAFKAAEEKCESILEDARPESGD